MSVTTDGASAMIGINNCFIKLKKQPSTTNFIFSLCHSCARKLEDVMSTVTKIVTLSLLSRMKFKLLFDEI